MHIIKQVSMLTIISTTLSCGSDNASTDNFTEAPPVATAPEVTASELNITQQSAQSTHNPFTYFDFVASGITSFQCSVNDSDREDCSSPFLAFPLKLGENNLTVDGLDASGQVIQSQSIQWQTDSIFGDTSQQSVHPDLVATNVQPAAVKNNSWRGILRLNCDFSHSSYDDPIVFPNQNDVAHLHRFYGNTLTDESSDFTSLFTSGESSCQGNTLNRSSYWVPALLAPTYNNATQELVYDVNGDIQWQVVPAVVGNDDEAHEVFYYSAGVSDLQSIQTIPSGLKMIAGDHMGNPTAPQNTDIVRWHCQSWESDATNNPQWSASIPECFAPDRLRMDIFFPSCWNGVDLDSDDHKSHMAYPIAGNQAGALVCPSAHPIPIIRVSYHYAFGVKPEVFNPASQSNQHWKLASDMYDTQASAGGMSLHADWFNAWHPEALQTVLDICIKGELDCHDGNLGNGFRLTGTRAGSQNEPPIVNGGSGY